MRRTAPACLVLLLAIAGCATPSTPDATATDEPMKPEAQPMPSWMPPVQAENRTTPSTPANSTPAPASSPPEPGPPANTTVEPRADVVVLDVLWNFTNGQFNPVIEEVEMARFNVTEPWANMTVHMAQVREPLFAVYADNGRVYDPDDELEQDSFDGDKIDMTFPAPKQGTWRLVYVTDEVWPQGEHTLRLVVVLMDRPLT